MTFYSSKKQHNIVWSFVFSPPRERPTALDCPFLRRHWRFRGRCPAAKNLCGGLLKQGNPEKQR